MDLSAIALQGLQQAQTQLEQSAARIASFGASERASGADTVDLSAEMVALLTAKNQTALNVKTLKIANEVQQNLIDELA